MGLCLCKKVDYCDEDDYRPELASSIYHNAIRSDTFLYRPDHGSGVVTVSTQIAGPSYRNRLTRELTQSSMTVYLQSKPLPSKPKDV